jgi:hypothetical protein
MQIVMHRWNCTNFYATDRYAAKSGTRPLYAGKPAPSRRPTPLVITHSPVSAHPAIVASNFNLFLIPHGIGPAGPRRSRNGSRPVPFDLAGEIHHECQSDKEPDTTHQQGVIL